MEEILSCSVSGGFLNLDSRKEEGNLCLVLGERRDEEKRFLEEGWKRG